MIGILCEKPSAARNFAKALGGMTGTFDGKQYVIVSARGHLYEFADPAKQVDEALSAKYKSWDIGNLPWEPSDFAWRYQENEEISDIKKLLSGIKKTLSSCDTILIGTDVDPTGEGELLAWEILSELKLSPKTWGRMLFMDESVSEIQNAFRNWQPIRSMKDDADWAKAFYRARWDYLSMQWTRIASGLVGGRRIVRFGRLKSAMVKIVGDGLAALAAYVPIPFYENRFKDENGVMYTNPKEPRYAKKEEVPDVYQDSPVVLDKKEVKSSAPPKLIDLSSLSAHLASKGYRASQVLACYQAMYEKQIVSYPRTEDKTITPEQFNELLPLVDKIAAVVGADPAKLNHRMQRKTHVKVGGAHGANRPGTNVPESLAALREEFGPIAPDIYMILAKSYLAMLASDYVYERQSGHLERYPDFVGATNVPISMGWKDIFPETDEEEEEETTSVGLGTVAVPFVYEGVNKKPPTPTMRWLMRQLKKYDVGTGATRTSTYADVTSTKTKNPLLIDTKGKITMAECGALAYGLLPETYIGDLRLTEQVAKEMREVAAGRLDPEEGLAKVAWYVTQDLDTMQRRVEELKRSKPELFAAFVPKERYECTWRGKPAAFSRVVAGHRFTDAECEALAAGQEITVMNFVGRDGKMFGAKGRLEVQEYKGKKYLGFLRTEYVNEDGTPRTDDNRSDPEQYASGKWKGKDVTIKRVWSGHAFTEDELKALFAGEEIAFEAVSKKGTTYQATGKLANQTYNGRKFVGFKPEFKKGR